MSIATTLIIACLVASFSASIATGGSLARCFTDNDCNPQLQCFGTTDPVSLSPCTDQDPYCLCIPRDSLLKLVCGQTADTCSEGEICTQIPSSLIEQIQPAFSSLKLQFCVDVSQAKFLNDVSPCQDDSECPDQAECVPVSSDASFCAASLGTKESLPEPTLESLVTDEPETAEMPSETEESDTEEVPSETDDPDTQESPSETEELDEAVCIAAESLRHMDREQLLYATHYRARVLCDPNRSCATPGHMVLYKGRAMMMSSYCAQVQCRSEIMHVNSPRYQPKLRIPSATEDLTFLAFAARHGTKTEEILLRTATRIGL